MMDDMKKQELAVELARFRKATDEGDLRDMLSAFKAMDDGGVFRELDEHTGYAAPEDVLQAADEASAPRKDPAEWGDSSGYASQAEDRQAVKDRIRAGVPEGDHDWDAVKDVRDLRDGVYGGDHFDTRGATFHGPVTVKAVKYGDL